ncbi:MAG: HAD family hydrolase [bacterium]
MLTTILFDLDGTLLPIDEKPFLELYFGLLAKRFSALGLAPDPFIRAVWTGTEAMRRNVGPATNEDVFWLAFNQAFPDRDGTIRTEFGRFYVEEFDRVQPSSQTHPLAREIIDILHAKGYGVALATNPLFPRIATEKRIRWAGLIPEDFLFITTYENSRASKPSVSYFQAVLDAVGKPAFECLMVGNDASEDMAAERLGIATYLLTDCLINVKNVDLSRFQCGSFPDLHRFVSALPNLSQS